MPIRGCTGYELLSLDVLGTLQMATWQMGSIPSRLAHACCKAGYARHASHILHSIGYRLGKAWPDASPHQLELLGDMVNLNNEEHWWILCNELRYVGVGEKGLEVDSFICDALRIVKSID